MTESAHSLRNTILLILDHLGLDPARIIARMSVKRRFDRIHVANRTCSSVQAINEAGAKTLGIALPAFALFTTANRKPSLTVGATIVVHVRAYRDGAGNLVPYADVDTVEALLKSQRPFTKRMYVPPSDGMVPRVDYRWEPADAGTHPADV